MKYSCSLSEVNQKVCTSSLAYLSPKHKSWDTHRAEADAVEAIYQHCQEFERYAVRIAGCAGRLYFCDIPNEQGGSALKLKHANFCRVRHCPVCQWRRSLMWQARFYGALPRVHEQHPSARWLFMTLTVRNCDISELKATLQVMSKAWNRLRLRQEFKHVFGFVRTTEVTRGQDNSAHPHFHVLLMVSGSYFSRGYVKQARWSEIWQECAKLDYLPMVDVRAVKPKEGQKVEAEGEDIAAFLKAAVAETLKYAVKPSDMVADSEWFLEMTRQLFKTRFIATGGVLKDVLRDVEENEEDLIQGDEEKGGDMGGVKLAFDWHKPVKKYKRNPKADR